MTAKAKQTTKDSSNPANEELLRQVEELTANLQRERADAMNIRRQHQEQIASLKSSVTASVIEQLLPVIDNFDRSLKHIPEDLKDNDYIKGVNSIVKQFEKSLNDLGVSRINTIGQPFDPNLHDAVSVEDGGEEGTGEIISEELQSGFVLGDQVIRHAMVKVKRG